MAQTIQKYWKKPFKVNGKSASLKTTPHEFGWRDWMDIAVRWRQNAELNDPVFWIDLIDNNEAGRKAFALQTPIISGQMKIIKYYPYFERCFNILKKLLPLQHSDLGYHTKVLLPNAKNAEQMWNLVGRDFYVITPCQPRAGSKQMEGTRLTLQKIPDGFLLSIRTPGISGRMAKYNKEFRKLWKDLAENAKEKKSKKHMENL